MYDLTKVLVTLSLTSIACGAQADAGKTPVPQEILNMEIVGMPTGASQEVRVLTAEVGPGMTTVHHTHRFPVTTYVLDGAMTFTYDGHKPITVTAGEAFVELPDTPVAGSNPSTTETAHVVIFYVSDPSTPFLDPVE
jgi:quercetin dioxygenase-like cupin family protein